MALFYSSISIYACQPLQTVSISCIKEHIPREIWGNVSSDVLLSHKELSVFQRYKALAGKAWDETCEFRRWSSAHSVIKVCHTFSVIIPKRHSDLKCDIFWLWRLLLCKAWFHPLNYMLYCDTVSEVQNDLRQSASGMLCLLYCCGQNPWNVKHMKCLLKSGLL